MRPALAARSKWMLALGAFGACLFVWGLRTWEPLHVVVYRAEVQHNQAIATTALRYRTSFTTPGRCWCA